MIPFATGKSGFMDMVRAIEGETAGDQKGTESGHTA